MLLSARTFRRRSRLAVLVLIGLVVIIVHRNRTSLQTVHVHLPEHMTADPTWWTRQGRGSNGLVADVSNTTLGVSLLQAVYSCLSY